MSVMGTTIWFLWDGDCDFCREAARVLRERDLEQRLTIIPYQEAPSPPMTPALRVQAERAVQLVTSDGDRRSGAEAILFALRRAGWHPALMGLLLRRPLLWCAEAVYRLIAGNRRRLGGLFKAG